MNKTNDQRKMFKRYLLGELSEDERSAIEDEYFLDRTKFEQICMIEDELLDNYARAHLSSSDLKLVESNYLTNSRRQNRANFAKAFTQIIDENVSAKSTKPQVVENSPNIYDGNLITKWLEVIGLSGKIRVVSIIAFRIVSLLLSGSVVWLLIENSRLQEQITENQRERGVQKQQEQSQDRIIEDIKIQNQKLAEEHRRIQDSLQSMNRANAHQSSPPPSTVSHELTIDAFRSSGGGESQPLVIPPYIKQVRLRINLTEYEFKTFQVALLTSDGNEVFMTKGIRVQHTKKGNYLIVDIPAYNFDSGDNIFSIHGITSSNELELLGKTVIAVRKQ